MKTMSNAKKRMDLFCDGFFFFFGFIDNPVAKQCTEILNTHPADKLKADIKRINGDYRRLYQDLRKEALCIE